eukprot:gene27084-35798_t
MFKFLQACLLGKTIYSLNVTSSKRSNGIDLFPCDNRSPVPMWSWALSRTCCDIFPLNGEARVMGDPNYILKNTFLRQNIVYVFIQDLPIFVNLVFIQLPMDHQVTLVTGMDDFGAPYEIFNPKGRFKVKPPISMRQFLLDPRLKRWYVQNYDIVGCNRLSNLCSDVTKQEEAALTAKVVPIPIGMDFHSFADKGSMDLQPFQEKTCSQRKQLEGLQRKAVPLHQRDLSIVASFDCSKSQEQKSVRRFALRKELCVLLATHADPSTYLRNNNNNKRKQRKGGPLSALTSFFSSSSFISGEDHAQLFTNNSSDKVNIHSIVGTGPESRAEFWSQLASNSSFAFAPFGRGLDTHRVWEVLQLGAIPIVLTSSLDRLYVQFPVLILKSWSQAFSESFLRMKRDDIISRFGSPFNSDVTRKLSLDYWVKLIRETP